MSNSKIKLFLLTLIATFLLSIALYLTFVSLKQLKVFGCTEIDIYEGSNHQKLEPKDLYCNLDLLELAGDKKMLS